ncbi:hypothetical protein PS647_06163 [Pseudomonas fluorescens]|nr:hypothetical protein PS647_06163 [Pseudomonas fluorescens]
MAPPTLNLETFARNRIILSDLPMHSLPPKLRHHPPLDPDSPNQLSDQINLMEYINGYSKSSKKDKLWRLNQAADYHQTRFIKNGTETPLNMDLAQKYRKKLHLITRNRRALKEIRTETFNSHFHY